MTKRAYIILGIIIILVLGVGIYGFRLLDQAGNVNISDDDEDLGITNEDEDENEEVDIDKEGVLNILLFGVDQGGGATDEERSDSIIIASLDWDNESIKLTSILRDTYIEIPGRGMDKLGHAYALDGPQLAIRTINENFNMDIRDFAAVDFEGFEEIVDSIDGVEIDVNEAEARHMGLEESGLQTLDGSRALEYSRIRKIGNADYERTERQRTVLQAAFLKMMDMNITRYPRLLDALLPHVETSLSKGKMLSLGREVFSSDIADINQLRIPANEFLSEEMIGGVSYVVPYSLEDNVELLHDFIYEDKDYKEDYSMD